MLKSPRSRRTSASLAATVVLLVLCGGTAAASDNELTEQEVRDGWRLLFDGKTTSGWMTTRGQPLPESQVQNGSLNPHLSDYMLVHEQPWKDFVLSLEFKISPGCNSGIFVRTWPLTPRAERDVGFNGIEIAVDDTRAAGIHDTGAVYDLVRPSENAMKPAGEWNQAVITCHGSRIVVELNGRPVTRMDLDEWTEPNRRPDGTLHKFDIAYRHHPRRGYVGLQDHGSDCWYRNIKLRPLASSDDNSPPDPLWDLEALRRPPGVTWVDPSGPLRRLYYENEPRHGRPTRVFAYCAFPERRDDKAPGIVLIHGGGGTAFKEWAELWAARGYVALAMDLAGKGPDRTPLPDGGPDQDDASKFPRTPVLVENVWSYHAVAASIRAGSILAHLPEVDPRRIAVTGISWGGYLTCIVAGQDDRFQAAVPVYGCGFLDENSAWLRQFAEMDAHWKDVWLRDFDPSRHVSRAKMPVLFVNGTNDFAYPLDSYQRTYRLVKDRTLCVTVNMPHGHPQGWAPQEIAIFIDHHLRGSAPLPGVDLKATVADDGKTASAAWRKARPAEAQLHWTADAGRWQHRQWHSEPARIADGVITADLPARRPLIAFFTIADARGATVSTEHFELP